MYQNAGTIRIRDDVKIMTLSLTHAPNMFRWMCDPSVSHNLGLREEPSLEKTITWIKNALNDSLIKPYAVLFCESHVGNIILDRLDHYLETARLSVYIGESSARRKGVGSSGIYLTLLEGFNRLDLYKIWLTVHEHNHPALNLYRKLGFHLEGRLRDEFWLNGKRIDTLYFGMLKDDFEKLNVTKIDDKND